MDLAKIREMDHNMCRHCGRNTFLHIHHLKFRSRGGKDTPENMITLCGYCHDAIHRYRLSAVEVLNRLKDREDFRWHEVHVYLIEHEKIKPFTWRQHE